MITVEEMNTRMKRESQDSRFVYLYEFIVERA